MRTLYANRLVVLFGSALLCLVGFVSGCDSGTSGPKAVETENKAKQDEQAKARQAAYGKSGYQTKAVKDTPKR